MSQLETRPYNAANYIKTENDCAIYLQAVIDDSNGDPESIVMALGDIAQARGLMKLSRKLGVSSKALAKALSPGGDPSFATVIKVCKALGLRLHAGPGHA